MKPHYAKRAKPKAHYQFNQFIRADMLRLVDDQAKQIGVMSKNDALRLAQEKDLDVVLVSPQANPPVAKLISLSKFKYQQQQKESSDRKSAKNVDIKEIRFTPFIAQGDFDIRIKRAREFLLEGNKVRLNVKFTGRQITRKDFGDKVLKNAIIDLSDISTVEREPALSGKILTTQLQPKGKKIINTQPTDITN